MILPGLRNNVIGLFSKWLALLSALIVYDFERISREIVKKRDFVVKISILQVHFVQFAVFNIQFYDIGDVWFIIIMEVLSLWGSLYKAAGHLNILVEIW